MVIELLDLDLPKDLVGGAVLNLNGHVSTVVEAAELRRSDLSLFHGAGLGSNSLGLLDSLVEGRDLTTVTLALFGVGFSGLGFSDALLLRVKGQGLDH
jgi:hypothetical protein